MEPTTPLTYLRKQMDGFGSFLSDYKALPEADKDTLKRWAQEEMDALKATA